MNNRNRRLWFELAGKSLVSNVVWHTCSAAYREPHARPRRGGKMMNFVVKMFDLYWKHWIYVVKMFDFVLKMLDFTGGRPRFPVKPQIGQRFSTGFPLGFYRLSIGLISTDSRLIMALFLKNSSISHRLSRGHSTQKLCINPSRSVIWPYKLWLFNIRRRLLQSKVKVFYLKMMFCFFWKMMICDPPSPTRT